MPAPASRYSPSGTSHSAPIDALVKSSISKKRKLRLALSTSPATRASSPRGVNTPREKLNVCCADAVAGATATIAQTNSSTGMSRLCMIRLPAPAMPTAQLMKIAISGVIRRRERSVRTLERAEPADDVEHLAVDAAVRRDEMRGDRIERRPVHPGHHSARFGNHQRPRRNVPRLEVLFPEAVEPPGRDITEIDRRGAEAPDRACFAKERAEQADEIVALFVHVVRKTGDEQRVDQPARARHLQSHAVQVRAFTALRREQLASRRVVDGGRFRTPVDFQRQRRAEDRQAVRVIRRPVERIEDPSMRRGRMLVWTAAQLLGQHVVVRKALGDHGAAQLLAFQIDLGDEVDRALLVDTEPGLPARHLDGAGAENDFSCGGEKDGVGAAHALSESCTDPARFTITISMPPSAARCRTISSMKLRIRKIPRPLPFSRFSGASGSGTSAGSNPGPSSRTRITTPCGTSDDSSGVNSTCTRFPTSLRFPCLIALMTDSRTATLTQWRASSSSPARRPMWSLTTCTRSSISKVLSKSSRTLWPLIQAVIPSYDADAKSVSSLRFQSLCSNGQSHAGACRPDQELASVTLRPRRPLDRDLVLLALIIVRLTDRFAVSREQRRHCRGRGDRLIAPARHIGNALADVHLPRPDEMGGRCGPRTQHDDVNASGIRGQPRGHALNVSIDHHAPFGTGRRHDDDDREVFRFLPVLLLDPARRLDESLDHSRGRFVGRDSVHSALELDLVGRRADDPAWLRCQGQQRRFDAGRERAEQRFQAVAVGGQQRAG